jgi:uncharacterized protein YggE
MHPWIVSTIVLPAFLVCSSFIHAQNPPTDANARPSLVVTGDGEAAGAPDTAMVQLGASVQTGSAPTSQEQVNATMQKVIEAIKATGIPEAQIKTTGLSLSPVYGNDPNPNREGMEPKIVGYRAANSVQVRLTEPARVGAAIDAGIRAGANELQGVFFSPENDAAQRRLALQRAVAKAKEKATVLADALNVNLFEIVYVSEDINSAPPPYMPMARFAADAMSTPVQPGESSVTARVTITYRIQAR